MAHPTSEPITLSPLTPTHGGPARPSKPLNFGPIPSVHPERLPRPVKLSAEQSRLLLERLTGGAPGHWELQLIDGEICAACELDQPYIVAQLHHVNAADPARSASSRVLITPRELADARFDERILPRAWSRTRALEQVVLPCWTERHPGELHLISAPYVGSRVLRARLD